MFLAGDRDGEVLPGHPSGSASPLHPVPLMDAVTGLPSPRARLRRLRPTRARTPTLNVESAHPQGPAAHPNMELAYPNVELAYPNVELAYPNVELAYPNVELAYPSVGLGFLNVGFGFPNV
ncbi:hypothetical protein GCM10027199_84050 [Amycolatopsis magusensis]